MWLPRPTWFSYNYNVPPAITTGNIALLPGHTAPSLTSRRLQLLEWNMSLDHCQCAQEQSINRKNTLTLDFPFRSLLNECLYLTSPSAPLPPPKKTTKIPVNDTYNIWGSIVRYSSQNAKSPWHVTAHPKTFSLPQCHINNFLTSVVQIWKKDHFISIQRHIHFICFTSLGKHKHRWTILYCQYCSIQTLSKSQWAIYTLVRCAGTLEIAPLNYVTTALRQSENIACISLYPLTHHNKIEKKMGHVQIKKSLGRILPNMIHCCQVSVMQQTTGVIGTSVSLLMPSVLCLQLRVAFSPSESSIIL